MTQTTVTAPVSDHDAPDEVFVTPDPLVAMPAAPARTPAEEARALVHATNLATLATAAADGTPWASMVQYVPLTDGTPVLCVSTLAEHGRNLHRDGRGSLAIAQTDVEGDPLAAGRVTLAGVFRRPDGAAAEHAAQSYRDVVPASRLYSGFGDFSFWTLDVERVRWVGGYGRMDSADAASYRAAEPDPVARSAAYAVRHLNDDHADALLLMAQALAGYTDATAARCTGADRYGLALDVVTPRGQASTRVGFAEALTQPDGLRGATVELTRRARGG